MRTAIRQAVIVLALVGSMTTVAVADGARGRYAEQLARECDGLMQVAVRRPYGWGWENVAAKGQGSGRIAPRQVTMEPLGSSAAGLLLLWSGQTLDEPKYRQAALEAARGVTAAQTSNGKILERAVFGVTAGGRDQPAVIPSRAGTRAGLVLLLEVIDSESARPEAITRSAQRASRWLMNQQNDDGGWPSSYPPEARARDARRIIRLDDDDYRDCTYALLLAGQIMDDPLVAKSAARSIEKLLALRLLTRMDQATTEPAPAAEEGALTQSRIVHLAGPLWSGAYRPDGSVETELGEFPAGADMVASRFAIQSLMGEYLLHGDQSAGMAMEAAARSLAGLRRSDGTWRRVYRTGPTTAPASAPATELTLADKFLPVASTQPAWTSGLFGLEPVLAVSGQVKMVGREQYVAMLERGFSVKQHLAAAVCGLNDSPLSLELPANGAESETYIKQHQKQWDALEKPVPEELSGRLQRLWVLLIRSKLEKIQNTAESPKP